jgi:hypothetical protein
MDGFFYFTPRGRFDRKRKYASRGSEARSARVFLDETIRCLRDHVQGMKFELVFNLDEVGISEWEYRKDRKVIVPKTMDGQTIHH